MEEIIARQQEVDEVPFWERASIRPRELAELKLRVKQLELKAEQSEKEWDIQNDLIRYLFASLGFDDWEFTQKGAEDAIKSLNELVTGKITVDEFGWNSESLEGDFDVNLLKLVQRVRELEGLALEEHQWVALIEVIEECKTLVAKLSLNGYGTGDLFTEIKNMIEMCQKGIG